MHPGAFVDAGFHFRQDTLWGPSLEGEPASTLWSRLHAGQAEVFSIYMSRAPKPASVADLAGAALVAPPQPL